MYFVDVSLDPCVSTIYKYIIIKYLAILDKTTIW